MPDVLIQIPETDYNIRSFRQSDAADIVTHADNPKVAETLRDFFPSPYTETDAKLWLRYIRQQDVETHFAITVADSCIGAIGLFLQEDVNRLSGELGYWLGEEFWGRGVMTKVISAFIPFAFRQYDIIRMHANVFSSNPASARVLEKCGFTQEGTLRQSVIKNSTVMDQKIYAILKRDL